MAGGSDTNSNARYYLTRNRFLAHKRGVYLTGPSESLQSLVLEEAGNIYDSNLERRFAAKQGIVDGLMGRVGRRVQAKYPALVEAQILPLRVLMKLKAWISRHSSPHAPENSIQ